MHRTDRRLSMEISRDYGRISHIQYYVNYIEYSKKDVPEQGFKEIMKSRNLKETELIYGVHPITEVLKQKKRKLYTLYTTSNTPEAFDEIQPLLAKGCNIQYVDREILAKMSGTTDHQGLIARVQPYVYRKKMFDPAAEPILILLDSIQDPRNVGSIIRTAACTGVNGVIIPTRHASPLSATVHKAAAGLTERIAIMQTTSSGHALELLKKAGYTTYLTTVEGAPIHEMMFQKPLCLVIGNEGKGISKTLYHYGAQVSLPQSADDISYNASVAAGIFMFYVATNK